MRAGTLARAIGGMLDAAKVQPKEKAEALDLFTKLKPEIGIKR